MNILIPISSVILFIGFLIAAFILISKRRVFSAIGVIFFGSSKLAIDLYSVLAGSELNALVLFTLASIHIPATFVLVVTLIVLAHSVLPAANKSALATQVNAPETSIKP